MNVMTLVTSLLQLVLFVGGLIAGIMLRGRDGKAALLVALGFGVQLLGVVLSVAEGVALSAYVGSAGTSPEGYLATMEAVTYGFGVVLRLLELAACLLIFLGLLRLVRRRRTTAATGVVR